jgi:hypothetical protein
MGLTWAAGWFGVWATIGIGSLVFSRSGSIEALLDTALFPLAGFVGGASFSLILGIAERRRSFDEMSLPRFAAWGAIGGLLMFGLAGGAGGSVYGMVVNGTIMALMCAGSAAGTLALARRADRRELLEAREGVDDVGLTQDEVRQLLS